MSDACKSRFTTWINQKCGGAMLGEVVVAEDYDSLIAINADLLEALQKIQFRCECFIEDDRDMSISSTEMIRLICDEAIAKALTPQS